MESGSFLQTLSNQSLESWAATTDLTSKKGGSPSNIPDGIFPAFFSMYFFLL
jgi:hypothetical protein